ncbi:MAG: 9-O-acetylesterase [Bacteroidales bacterium]|nr:9-O-acetylesterase [Bacteroidales bacterium]
MVLAALAGGTAVASAAVTLPHFYTDNMVVQRNSVITIPGTAAPGVEVTASADWNGGVSSSAKADADGRFALKLPTPDAGGPYTIVVTDGDAPAVLSNVLSGEVWLCSGQSNMEFPVKGWTQIMNADEVVATSNHPEIRLLQIKKNTSYKPLDDAEVNMGGWVEANPAAMDFSAIAYLFALQMTDELGVPVGVVDATWGGTPAEAWTPYEYFDGVAGFEDELGSLKRSNFSKEGLVEDYNRRVAEWNRGLEGIDVAFDRGVMQSGERWGEMPVPGEWENSVLNGFDGIVWVQREVELPASAAGKPLLFHSGPIDNEDITYFNGVQVGDGSSWSDPRAYDVPGRLVKEGKNVISIRITDFDGGGGICGSADDLYVEVDGKRYPLAGNWNYTVAGDFRTMPPYPTSVQGSGFPTVLYNAMIAPLNVMPVKGVLWYQGCANVGRAEQYAPLFRQLINGWRAKRGEDIPFYFVQLAGWLRPQLVQPDSEWAALRDSQAKALSLPNTGMAVAIDLGHPADIHPVDKQEVARRLGLLALNRTYGKECVDAAPVCVASESANGKMVLRFDGKLAPKAGIVTGFIIGDKDGNFASATARMLADDTVELSSPLIAAPVVARYNWADYPFGSLTGETGLPVAPFATDK